MIWKPESLQAKRLFPMLYTESLKNVTVNMCDITIPALGN